MIIFLFSIFCGFFQEATYVKYEVNQSEERKALCNDLSPSIYYLRKPNVTSTKWFLYLQGGGGCYDEVSCQNRWNTAQSLMTSKGHGETVLFNGIGSNDCSINPAYCEYNQVFFVYCSSDWWSGNHFDESAKFSFLGKNIVSSIIEDLIDDHGMNMASEIVLSGASAGGVGTFSNSDDVHELLKSKLSSPSSFNYSILSDSGWFLDGQGYNNYTCTENAFCWYEKRILDGAPMWNLQPHKACGAFYSKSPWDCLVGYKLYPFIESRKFAIFNIFDLWQALQDTGKPILHIKDMDKKEKEWVFNRGKEVYQTIEKDKMENHGIMALGCYDHGTIPFNSYSEVKNLNGKLINEVILEFEQGGNPVSIDHCSEIACNNFCRTR